jgi:GTPase SAR1 family protein
VYSVDDKYSFKEIESRVYSLDSKTENPKIIKILVGNKSEVEFERRKVSFEEGKEFAEDQNMEFFEVSARSDQ